MRLSSLYPPRLREYFMSQNAAVANARKCSVLISHPRARATAFIFRKLQSRQVSPYSFPRPTNVDFARSMVVSALDSNFDFGVFIARTPRVERRGVRFHGIDDPFQRQRVLDAILDDVVHRLAVAVQRDRQTAGRI